MIPLYSSSEASLGVCLRVAPTVDTSQWRAELTLAAIDGSLEVAASRRMASTVCFERPMPAELSGRRSELSGVVNDRFDHRRWRLARQPFEVLAEGERPAALSDAVRDALRSFDEQQLAPFIASLETFAERAASERLPAFALRLRLIAAHYQRSRGGLAGRVAARQLVDSAPQWLAEPAASPWAALVEQERLELERVSEVPNWATMRLHLAAARERYESIADPKAFTIAMQEASLLERAGAAGHAIETLRTALEDCRELPCNPGLLRSARSNLAWLLLTDPLADDDQLAEAEEILRALLATERPQEGAVTRANRLLNLAYLELRRSRDPGSRLAEARAELAATASTERAVLLLFADLIAADSALVEQQPRVALDICRRVGLQTATRWLAAWAAGCEAEAHRLLLDFDAAQRAFGEALALHEKVAPQGLDERFSIAPGRRANDFFRGARVAVENGNPAEAWKLLERLDALSEGAGSCGISTGAAAELLVRRRQLEEQLAALDRPASVPRERQAEPLRRFLSRELAALSRREEACAAVARAVPAAGAGLRAFPLADEVLVLERSRTGQVRLKARVQVERRALHALIRQSAQELRQSAKSDRLWAALGRALVPAPAVRDRAERYPVLGYWLHGSLQGLPLAALPDPSSGGRLSERYVAVRMPAVVWPGHSPPPRSVAGRAMFVVDPVEDLPSGPELARLYRQLFPRSRILAGKAATTGAVRQAIGEAGWLHFDVHGRYDEAFPELSRLLLSDGGLAGPVVAGLAPGLRGVNLLGCWTGAWPPSADSGRYGLAGAFARAGSPWTIASRSALPDAVARDFNAAFYPRFAADGDVAQAYGHALSVVRSKWPGGEWMAMILLRGAPDVPTGNSDGSKLPQNGGT